MRIAFAFRVSIEPLKKPLIKILRTLIHDDDAVISVHKKVSVSESCPFVTFTHSSRFNNASQVDVEDILQIKNNTAVEDMTDDEFKEHRQENETMLKLIEGIASEAWDDALCDIIKKNIVYQSREKLVKYHIIKLIGNRLNNNSTILKECLFNQSLMELVDTIYTAKDPQRRSTGIDAVLESKCIKAEYETSTKKVGTMKMIDLFAQKMSDKETHDFGEAIKEVIFENLIDFDEKMPNSQVRTSHFKLFLQVGLRMFAARDQVSSD